jgi:hypothetical protein
VDVVCDSSARAFVHHNATITQAYRMRILHSKAKVR